MELTARDTEILRTINRHRFLRSHHISDLVGGSRQQVLRRLQKLYHHGYVERPACQIDYYQKGGSRSMAYGLGSRGASHLRRVANIPFSGLHWTSHNRAVKRLFLEHALMISDIMVALEMASRASGHIRILHETELTKAAAPDRNSSVWRASEPNGKKIAVFPDQIFALEDCQKRQRVICLLEADRGTMPIRRSSFSGSSIDLKFRNYVRAWREIQSRFSSTRIRVFTVTVSEHRSREITACASTFARGKGLFLQTHLGAHLSSPSHLTKILE